MAIEEIVKADVAGRLSALETQLRKNLAEIADHQAAIARLEADNISKQALIAAYDKDIPKPTPVASPL